MKPRAECSYYLVREFGGLGVKAKAVYFDDMIAHVREDGLVGLSRIEVKALIAAAERRDRLPELEEAVKGGCNGKD